MKRNFFLFAVFAVVFFLNQSVTAQEWDHMEQPMTGICKDSASPTYIDYGYVALGVLNTHTFFLSNTGDTSLIVQSIDGISYPIVGVRGIAPGTVIPKGQANGIHVGVAMSLYNYIDTTVILTIHFQSDCAGPMLETLQIAASFINPQNTGHPFPPTFLNCRSQVDSIQARDIGTVPIILKRIDILAANPGETPREFSFANGMQTLLVGKLYPINHRENYIVFYYPSIEGPVSATIQCTWDSLGKLMYSHNILTGIGKLERDTLAPSQSLYYGHAGNVLDIPINLTRNLPADVQAMGITFTVTYSHNNVELIQSKLHDYDTTLSDFFAPSITIDGLGNERVTFTLKSSYPISKLQPILTLHFAVIAKNDTTVPLTLSDAGFWEYSPQDTLCYVITSFDNALLQLIGSHNAVEVLPSVDHKVGVRPNPLSQTTMINFSSSDRGFAQVAVINLLGSEVARLFSGELEAGAHSFTWDARAIPPGMYECVIRMNGHAEYVPIIVVH